MNAKEFLRDIVLENCNEIELMRYFLKYINATYFPQRGYCFELGGKLWLVDFYSYTSSSTESTNKEKEMCRIYELKKEQAEGV